MPLSVRAETSQAEREESQVQQEPCGQLNSVTAADVTRGPDLSPQLALGISGLLRGNPDCSDKSRASLHTI